MSAICGIYRQDGQPVSPENIEKQMAALAHCGPDGSGVWHSGNVGLGHQMMHITPESLKEELPVSSREIPELVITADARLDSREELCAILGIPLQERTTIPDSQLILAAYQKWNHDCPTHLLGDFAFAIWDGTRQTLFCARDHLGVLPFYYHFAGCLFVFASDIQGVIAHSEVPRVLNDLAIAMHLWDIPITSKNITFIRAVRILPPAHMLIIDAHGMQIQRYWSPDNSPPIRLPSLDTYAEMLRDLLQQAVDCRLRSAYPVGAHLSGGLDSSAVAVLAARSLHQRGQTLPTFNWTPPLQQGDDPNNPEWAFIRLICEQNELTYEHVELTSKCIADQLWRDISLHHALDFWYEPMVRQSAKRHGVRVLLSGWGGDELITFNGEGYYAELFWSNQWKKLVHAIRLRGRYVEPERSFVQNLKRWLGTSYRKVFLPSLSDHIYALLDRKWLTASYAECATPAFAAYIRQQRPLPSETLRERVGLHAQQLALLEYGHLPQRTDAWANDGAYDRIVYAYPLLDKRIIEFSLGIPADLYVQKGYARYLYRYAMDGILPDEICWSDLKLEPQRVRKLMDVGREAVQIWLSQARKNGCLEQSENYIDAEKLVICEPKSNSSANRILHYETMIKSIQVLVAGNEWMDDASGDDITP